LRLAPGTALVESRHPIVTIWQAHRSNAADRFAPVRAAFETGAGECALVARLGWRATVRALPAGEARFTQAVLNNRSLGDALVDAGDDFDFEAWLIAALQQQRLAAVEPVFHSARAPVADATPFQRCQSALTAAAKGAAVR
jgi:hypothetical protein